MVQLEFSLTKPRRGFAEFHRANPGVLVALRDLALAEVRAGRRRLSIREFWEKIRREPWIVKGDRPWRLDNNHAPEYARVLADTVPELAGVFEFRNARTSTA